MECNDKAKQEAQREEQLPEGLLKEFGWAIKHANLEKLKDCVAANSKCVLWQDENGNNAMHVAVKGFFSVQAPEIMHFLLTQTEVNLHQKNTAGLDPFGLSVYEMDKYAQELIEPRWYEQLDEKYSRRPRLRLVVNHDDACLKLRLLTYRCAVNGRRNRNG